MRVTTKAIDRAVTVGYCEVMARKHLAILGVTLPLPRFTVVARVGARWGGRCKWRSDWTTCVIEIHETMTGNPRDLERVVAHEIIHHVVFMQQGRAGRWVGHGGVFLEMLAKLNATLGEGFVTTMCGDDYLRAELARPIHLVLWRRLGGTVPSVGWYARATARTQRTLMRLAAGTAVGQGEVRVVQTRAPIWAHFPRIGARARFGLAGDSLTPDALALWEIATPVTLTPTPTTV